MVKTPAMPCAVTIEPTGCGECDQYLAEYVYLKERMGASQTPPEYAAELPSRFHPSGGGHVVCPRCGCGFVSMGKCEACAERQPA